MVSQRLGEERAEYDLSLLFVIIAAWWSINNKARLVHVAPLDKGTALQPAHEIRIGTRAPLRHAVWELRLHTEVLAGICCLAAWQERAPSAAVGILRLPKGRRMV